MTTVLVVQPSPANPVGPLGEWLQDAGARLRTVRPFDGDAVPADLTGIDGLVCLGGEADCDDAALPWLGEVRALLAAAVSARMPTLALCLGAQLLAVATGGAVAAMPDGPEAGLRLVAKRDAAATDPLLAGLPFTPDVLQFHTAEVSRLPAAATLLAVSPQCTNQAFRVGACAWGLQFHIETTPELVRQWMSASPDVAAVMPAATPQAGVLERGHADLAETWAPIAARFVALAGRPAGRGVGEGRVDLPLLGEP